MATRTWNGSVWDVEPVSGDTIDVTSTLALPAGGDIPSAGTYNFNISAAVTFDIAAFLPAVGGVCGSITLGAVAANVTVAQNFAGATIGNTATLTIGASCASSATVAVGTGTLAVGAGFTLTVTPRATATVTVGALGTVSLGAGSGLNGYVAVTATGAITLGAASVLTGFISTSGSADNDITWTIGAGASVIIDATAAQAGKTLCLGEVTLTGLSVSFLVDSTLGLAGEAWKAVSVAEGATLTTGALNYSVNGDVNVSGVWTGTGTITIGDTCSLTLASTSMNVTIDAAGKVVTASSGINISGAFSVANGTYAAESETHTFGNGFSQSGGTVTAGVPCEWIFNGTGNLALTDALSGVSVTVQGATTVLTLDANLSVGEVLVETSGATLAMGARDVSCGGTFLQNAGTTVTGTGTLTLTSEGFLGLVSACAGLAVVVAGAGANVTASVALSCETFTLTSGAYNDGGFAHTIAGDVTHTAGTFTSTGAWGVAGTFAQTAGTFSATGTWTFTPAGPKTLKIVTATPGMAVILAGDQAITAGANMSIKSLSVTATVQYDGSTYDHSFAGSCTQAAGASIAGTGTWTVSATGTLTITTAVVNMPIVISGGTVTLGGILSCKSINITGTSVFDGSTYAITCAGSFTQAATATVLGSGLLKLTATGNLYHVNALRNVEVDAALATVTATAGITCKLLTCTACTEFALSTFTHTITAGFVQAGGTVSGTGTIDMAGTGTLTLTTALTGLAVIVSAGTVTLGNALSCESVAVTGTATFAGGANTITVATHFTQEAGTTVTGTGLLKLTGVGNLLHSNVARDIEVDSSGTVTATGIIVCKTFTLTSNTTLAMAAYNHVFHAGFVQAAGTITGTGTWSLHGAGNATFTCTTVAVGVDDGEITLTGALSCKSVNVAAGATLTGGAQAITCAGSFVQQATSTVTGTGSLTLNGSGAATLSLISACVGLDVTINNADAVITCGAALSCEDFLITTGSYNDSGLTHTTAASAALTAGTLTTTGDWTVGTTFTVTNGSFSATGDWIVGGDITHTAGTFSAGAGAWAVAGTFLQAAGTFTATGTWTLTPGAPANLTIITENAGLALVVSGASTLTATRAHVLKSLSVTDTAIYAGSTFAHTFSGTITQVAGAQITGTGTWTMLAAGSLKISTANTGMTIVLNPTTGTIALEANLSCKALTVSTGTFAGSTYTITCAGSFIQTAGSTVSGSGTLTLTAGTALTLIDANVDRSIVINTATSVVVGAALTCNTFTCTAATALNMGSFDHTFHGGMQYTAGTVSGTGIWSLHGTANLAFTCTTAYLKITAGTLTQNGLVSVAAIWLEPGTTLDGNSQDMVLSLGRVTGYGTLSNLTVTGTAVHCGPDVVDGGGNHATLVVFDEPLTRVGLGI